MSDKITVTGVVATPPKELTVAGDLRITTFRLASGQRRFDKVQNRWVDGATNWYTVTAFRHLAVNAGRSINKGDRIVASGRLRVRDWESGEKKGTSIDIDADALGHDLAWGTSVFTRVQINAAASAEQAAVDQALAAQSFAEQQPAETGLDTGADPGASDWATPGLLPAVSLIGDAHDGDGEWSSDPGELQPTSRAADATSF